MFRRKSDSTVRQFPTRQVSLGDIATNIKRIGVLGAWLGLISLQGSLFQVERLGRATRRAIRCRELRRELHESGWSGPSFDSRSFRASSRRASAWAARPAA